MLSYCRVESNRWRRPYLGLIAGLVAGCGAGFFAVAQDSTPGANDANNMFRNLDSNKDGRLTMEEAGPNSRAMLEQIFRMAGKQSGGSVSRTEFQKVFDEHRARSGGARPNPPPRDAGRPAAETPADPPAEESAEEGLPPLLARLDNNGDGRLTRAELQRLTQLFERLDADKDGALSLTEIQAVDSLPKTDGKSPADAKSSSKGSRSTPSKKSETTATPSGSRTGNRPATGTSGSSPRMGQTLPTGVWRGWVVNGRGETPNSGQMEIELTVEGNQITGREIGTQRAPGGLGGGTFVISGDGKSGNLDAEGNSGPQDGRSFMGIYEFDGETLRWCVANRGRTRPQVMATDRGNYLMVLRQQK